eukprot:gene12428-biopygen12475
MRTAKCIICSGFICSGSICKKKNTTCAKGIIYSANGRTPRTVCIWWIRGWGGAPPGLADRAGSAGPAALAGPVGLADLARVTRLAH